MEKKGDTGEGIPQVATWGPMTSPGAACPPCGCSAGESQHPGTEETQGLGHTQGLVGQEVGLRWGPGPSQAHSPSWHSPQPQVSGQPMGVRAARGPRRPGPGMNHRSERPNVGGT